MHTLTKLIQTRHPSQARACLLCMADLIEKHNASWVDLANGSFGSGTGRVALGSVMVGSGSDEVWVSGQIRVNHVRVWFGFGSVGVWVGYISGYLRWPGSDRVWVGSNLDRVGFDSMFG